METLLDLGFMVFGLGFFIFVISFVHRILNEDYNKRVMEAREFGFGGKNQHTARTLRDK